MLQLTEVAKPTPKDNEVLIKVHAASINAADVNLLRGEPVPIRLMYGLRTPKHQIFGIDLVMPSLEMPRIVGLLRLPNM
ncbi:MAG: hypothetical protein HC876_04325 [Chloroflexaceae bacterium]|nr:hypothetical protein [Chloroflexaceae bacterium]